MTDVPPPLTTFIKQIELTNDQNQNVFLIDNFCRTNQTKSLVYDINQTRQKLNSTARGIGSNVINLRK